MADESSAAIYSPPKEGLPYLIVTIEAGEITSCTSVRSRDDARSLVASQTIKAANVVRFGLVDAEKVLPPQFAAAPSSTLVSGSGVGSR